jgi:acetylornithine deacetylase
VPSSLGELTAALVAIDSVNPALVPGGAGEREIASFVADWCVGTGFETEVLGDERPSVIATKRGSGGGRSLLLNGHLDTVGVTGMEAPFEPRIEDDRLYGRGRRLHRRAVLDRRCTARRRRHPDRPVRACR